MSASMYWSTKPTEKLLNCDSSTMRAIERVFGDRITMDDYPKLEAIFQATEEKAYHELMELVLKHEEIHLSVRY